MTQARAEEIARSIGQRHRVIWRSQPHIVVNVSRSLSPGTPVSHLFLSPDPNAPLLQAGIPVKPRDVWEEPR